tara:strand:- start:555 stop:731 length:177 start_codon:yes stop_codon:yes gene_type:complete
MLRRLRSRGDGTRAQEMLRSSRKSGLFLSLKMGLMLGENMLSPPKKNESSISRKNSRK